MGEGAAIINAKVRPGSKWRLTETGLAPIIMGLYGKFGESAMKVLMPVSLSEKLKAAVRAGSMGERLSQILEETNPEIGIVRAKGGNEDACES